MSNKIQYRNAPLLLAQVRETLITQFKPLFHHFGLTEQQWRILRVLNEQEMEPRELCDTCQILSPSMAGILKRMEQAELINRRAIKGDRRRQIILLTDKSRDLIEKMAPLVEQQYRYIEEAWGDELLNSLYHNLDAIMDKKALPIRSVEL